MGKIEAFLRTQGFSSFPSHGSFWMAYARKSRVKTENKRDGIIKDKDSRTKLEYNEKKPQGDNFLGG